MSIKVKRLLSIVCTVLILCSGGITSYAAEIDKVLTKRQKQDYYEEYQDIVEKISEEVGTKIELLPLEKFADSDWKTPEQFERSVREIAHSSFEFSEETVNISRSSGSATKTGTITCDNTSYNISVTGNFTTQYSSYYDRQMFQNVNSITSKIVGSLGTWNQISYEASKIDAGRTYYIVVSGNLTVAGVRYTKTFNIQFYCDAKGAIS